jgi:hypothetical protein
MSESAHSVRFGRVGQRLIVAAAVATLGASGMSLASPAGAGQGPASVPTCTPELVYVFDPGAVDVRGSGVGHAERITYTDADGTPRPDTDATVAWSVHAVVEEPRRSVGVGPRLGGNLTLAITTGAGERLTFEATCMAGVGAYTDGIIMYANGMTRGWPGSQARRTFVHFEAWRDGPDHGAYVALIDGQDCRLNFGSLLVTESPFAIGTGSFTGLKPGFAYSETDCSSRFGDPKPKSRAPGSNRQ